VKRPRPHARPPARPDARSTFIVPVTEGVNSRKSGR
jgi:hypothetical protein